MYGQLGNRKIRKKTPKQLASRYNFFLPFPPNIHAVVTSLKVENNVSKAFSCFLN